MNRRTTLQRRTPLRRTSGLRRTGLLDSTEKPKARKPMKRSRPDRDWSDAVTKLEHTVCRLCGDPRVEAAHVIGRENDRPKHEGTQRLWVNPDAVIPMCHAHHVAYDAHELDILSVLQLEEQIRAVIDAGGIELARVRTAPLAYRNATDGRTD
jgi:hypothetical protein